MKTLRRKADPAPLDVSDEYTESPIEGSTNALTTKDEPAGAPDEPTRGPLWRVVGGSLATGFVGALVLTLGVFAGAREHLITGSALLSFALGWALLAVLSTRLTDQPQKWAVVPAAFMASVGLAMIVMSPDDQALNAAGWVWPAVVLALTGWIVVRLRRGLVGRDVRDRCQGAR